MKTIEKKKVHSGKKENIINNERIVFTDADFPVGTASHQGDVILLRIKSLPKSAKKRPSRQLSEGETMGSRHIVESSEIFDCEKPEVSKLIKESFPKSNVMEYLIGPVFKGCELDHPEHGNQVWPSDMIIATVFQRNLDSEEKERKVID